jgi:golgin subfamily B member 1
MAFNTQITNLSTENTTLKEQTSTDATTIATLDAQIDSLNDQISKLNADDEADAAKIAELTKQVDQLNAEKATLNTQITNVTNQNKTLTTENTTLKTENTTLKDQNAQLTKLLNESYYRNVVESSVSDLHEMIHNNNTSSSASAPIAKALYDKAKLVYAKDSLFTTKIINDIKVKLAEEHSDINLNTYPAKNILTALKNELTKLMTSS